MDDGLAEALFVHLLAAVNLVGALRLQIFAAQAATDADRHVGAIAALLPGAQFHQRGDLLGLQPLDFFNSPKTLAISNMTAVPDDGSTDPIIQASR